MSGRHLELLYGKDICQRISNANLLIIGVGGIGCELLKNLPKAGFRRFTILDLDIIEETNLNRQFIFRKSDVGSYKSEVGARRAKDLDPSLQITALKDDIRGGDFDVDFFRQFDAVISALDNMKARAYVAMMCMKAGRHMVDAGTQGYNGQTKTVVRGLSECHNCRPPQVEVSPAVCTIRSRPELPIHCVTYAKNFYDCFFGGGGDSENSFKGDLKLEEFISGEVSDEDIDKACRSVFEALFHTRIVKKEQEQELKSHISTVHPLTVEHALSLKEVLTNPPSTHSQVAAKQQRESPFEEEKLWSVATYADRFLSSLANILKHRKSELGQLSFEKDDPDCMMLVYCTSTLRTYNFMNRESSHNRHRYQTYYECKDLAGNVIPAIASTNSIAAATEVQELIKLLAEQHDKLNYVTYYNDFREKLMGSEHNSPNPSCVCCSKRSLFLMLECDFDTTTFGMIDEALRPYLSYGRDFQIKYVTGPQAGRLGTLQLKSLQDNKLNYNAGIINEKQTISFDLFCTDETEMLIGVEVHNSPGCEGVRMRIPINAESVKRDLLDYKREMYQNKRSALSYLARNHILR